MAKNLIGDNIRRILANNKATRKIGVPYKQVELAEAIGTSRQQIGAYVNGRHVMSTATLLKMADVLGVTQYELMGTEEDQTIFAIGREVAKSPILKELVKKVVAGEITDKQLNKVVEVITSLK